MTYKVLYREWRPQNFAQITGQEPITLTLQNAVLSQRIAHAYLFCGPRGTGKTSTAKVFAKALNCLNRKGAEPCGQCSNCQEITLGSSMDVIEIDAASNRGIDEVREIRENVKFLPTSGFKRVYIIDEVHMLTDPAFNALLKTLEEPPEHLVFILATTEAHKLPLTILSRCQRFDFRRISEEVMAAQLQKVAQAEGMKVEEAALNTIIQAADGGLRDALGLLDQVAILGQGQVSSVLVNQVLGLTAQEVLEQFVQALGQGNSAKCLELIDRVYRQGQDLQRLVLSLTSFLRQKMVDWWEDPTLDNKSQWLEALHLLSGLEPEMRWNSQPRIILELALVQACHLLSRKGSEKAGDLELKIGDLEREIQALLAGANRPVKLEAAETQIVLPVEADELSEPKTAESSWEMDVWEEIGDFSQLSSVKPAIQTSISPPKGHREIKVEPNPVEEANQKTKKKARAVAETNPEVQPDSAAIQAENQQRLKKIIADWPEVLNYIQSYPEYNHLGAYLNNGQGAWPWQLWEQNLLVAVWTGDSGSEIMFKLLEEEANRKALAQAVEKVCGWKPEVRFQLTEQKPPLKKAARPSVKSEVENLFEAEEVRNNPLTDNPFENEPF